MCYTYPSDDNVTSAPATAEEIPSVFLPEVFRAAKHNYAQVCETKVDDVGVAGWSVANVCDWTGIEAVTLPSSSCWSFSDPVDGEGLGSQNAQIARLIVALGENDSGRRTVLRLVADGRAQCQSVSWPAWLMDRPVRSQRFKLLAEAHSSR